MDHSNALSEIALVLSMAFAGGIMLRRFGQPALVGYILVGFLLGPSVLGVISNSADISLMAEMGILLLLFILGLELDLRSFGEVWKIAVNTALLQIFASLAIMGTAGWLLDWPIERILLLGFAISLSSTAVAIKTIEDAGGSIDTSAGRIAVGVLIAQDLAVIVMLLVINSFESGSFNPWDLLKIAGAIGVMGGVMFYLSRREFKFTLPAWLEPGKQMDSSQTIIRGLAWCFCGAALAGAAGLSASYGAFLAGLVIGSTQDHSKIEEQARPLFDVLMMVFFLSVGLLVDLQFVIDHIVSLIVLLFAIMFLKTVFNTVILYKQGLSLRNSLLMGSVLGQIGEFSFILAASGFASGAIGEEAYKYAVSLIAMSLIFTPVWIDFIRAAKRFLRTQANKQAAASEQAP